MPGVADAYLRAVREKYNAIEIWPESDRWLAHVKQWIAGAIAEWQPRLGLTPNSRILNAGSGDESYSIAPGMVCSAAIVASICASVTSSFHRNITTWRIIGPPEVLVGGVAPAVHRSRPS